MANCNFSSEGSMMIQNSQPVACELHGFLDLLKTRETGPARTNQLSANQSYLTRMDDLCRIGKTLTGRETLGFLVKCIRRCLVVVVGLGSRNSTRYGVQIELARDRRGQPASWRSRPPSLPMSLHLFRSRPPRSGKSLDFFTALP